MYVPRPRCPGHHQPPVKKKESIDQLVSCCWLPRCNQSRHKSSKHLTWESTFRRDPCMHQDLPRRRRTRCSRRRSVRCSPFLYINTGFDPYVSSSDSSLQRERFSAPDHGLFNWEFSVKQPSYFEGRNFLVSSLFLLNFTVTDPPRGGLHLLFGHHKQWGPPQKTVSKPYLNCLENLNMSNFIFLFLRMTF